MGPPVPDVKPYGTPEEDEVRERNVDWERDVD